MEYDNVKIVGVMTFIVCGVAYFGRGYIYEKLNNKAALFVTDVLNDNKVKTSIKKSAEEIVDTVISNEEYITKGNTFMYKFVEKVSSDSRYVNKATLFMNNILQNQEMKENLLEYLLNILSDDEMMHLFSMRAMQLLENITSNEELKTKVIKYLQDILEDENNQAALVELLSKTLSNPELHDTAANFIKETMNRNDVQHSINETLTTAAVKNFNDEEVKTASKAMIIDTLKSNEVRTEASDAAYDILKKLVVPKWGKS